MASRSASIIITRLFVLLNILIWLSLGIIIAFNVHPAVPDQPLLKALMAAGSLVLAAILSGLFFLMSKQNRVAYFLIVALFITTSLLTIFDDFGWVDLIVLVINLIPLGLLLKDRKWYLSQPSRAL